MKNNKRGFTLIELLVVIAIIGLLSTLAVVALNNAREKSRDARRLSDVKQIQTALELFYNECNSYPIISAAGSLATTMANIGEDSECPTGITLGTFLNAIPTPPTPADGGDTCQAANTYEYESTDSDGDPCTSGSCASYTIEYCLGGQSGGVTGNVVHYATPAGIQ